MTPETRPRGSLDPMAVSPCSLASRSVVPLVAALALSVIVRVGSCVTDEVGGVDAASAPDAPWYGRLRPRP